MTGGEGKKENMSVYTTIDLDSLMCKLSSKELYNFMLETFRDRVPDESHISLITEMFKVMCDADQEDALAKMVLTYKKEDQRKENKNEEERIL